MGEFIITMQEETAENNSGTGIDAYLAKIMQVALYHPSKVELFTHTKSAGIVYLHLVY